MLWFFFYEIFSLLAWNFCSHCSWKFSWLKLVIKLMTHTKCGFVVSTLLSEKKFAWSHIIENLTKNKHTPRYRPRYITQNDEKKDPIYRGGNTPGDEIIYFALNIRFVCFVLEKLQTFCTNHSTEFIKFSSTQQSVMCTR